MLDMVLPRLSFPHGSLEAFDARSFRGKHFLHTSHEGFGCVALVKDTQVRISGSGELASRRKELVRPRPRQRECLTGAETGEQFPGVELAASLLASQTVGVEKLEETQVPFLQQACYAASTYLQAISFSQAGGGFSLVSA